MQKIVFYLALKSRSKVGVNVKVTGQGQRSMSTFRRTAVDIRGSAVPSAAKCKRSHHQFNSFVCVSVISAVDRLFHVMSLIILNYSSRLVILRNFCRTI